MDAYIALAQPVAPAPSLCQRHSRAAISHRNAVHTTKPEIAAPVRHGRSNPISGNQNQIALTCEPGATG
jgi:hypothetical protein